MTLDPYKLAVPKLSYEDICWVQAIADRVVLTRGWSQEEAYKEALASVEGFYQEQITQYGWVERLVEHQLHIKRVAYEKETDKIAKRREQDREFEVIRFQKMEEKRKAARAQEVMRQEKHEELREQFVAAGGRGRWVYREYLGGRLQTSIAAALGVSKSRVSEIINKEHQLERARRERVYKTWLTDNHNNRGRPVDMGGPRDVWLTYYPSPDPRLDNMEPVEQWQ